MKKRTLFTFVMMLLSPAVFFFLLLIWVAVDFREHAFPILAETIFFSFLAVFPGLLLGALFKWVRDKPGLSPVLGAALGLSLGFWTLYFPIRFLFEVSGLTAFHLGEGIPHLFGFGGALVFCFWGYSFPRANSSDHRPAPDQENFTLERDLF